MGNEKAINQFIAHHGIVFEPKKKLVWVSTAPFQMGQFVAYDLNKIFSMHGLQTNHEVYDSALVVPADTFLVTQDFAKWKQFHHMKEALQQGESVDIPAFINTNPEFYHTYWLAGDYYFKRKDYAHAKQYYEQALTKVIATRPEEKKIREQLAKSIKALQ
jgi:tetratricopeptide (TPR) repeat protein